MGFFIWIDGMDEEYQEFCDKFEIADEVGEDRGDLMEAIARLLISMTEAEQ